MAPEAGFVLDAIASPHDVLFSAYHDVVMQPWNTRGVVALGDAAHAMSPQLGQGANLALWDAMVLADAVEAERGDVVRALHRYSRARRDHLGYYQWVTRALTPFFQSDHDVLGAMRDLFMPMMCRVSLFKQAMVLGMCGTADGHPWRRVMMPGG
jgi:2-polyprenyl-6-methoxyphenol hydroxylase-like FAD-dependent oxidoreductase